MMHTLADAFSKLAGAAVFAASCWYSERRYRQHQRDRRARSMFAGNRQANSTLELGGK